MFVCVLVAFIQRSSGGQGGKQRSQGGGRTELLFYLKLRGRKTGAFKNS